MHSVSSDECAAGLCELGVSDKCYFPLYYYHTSPILAEGKKMVDFFMSGFLSSLPVRRTAHFTLNLLLL